MIKDHCEEGLVRCEVPVNVQEIEVFSLPQGLREPEIDGSDRRPCEKVGDYLINLRAGGHGYLHYVLGLSYSHTPMEQAVLRIGSHYFDPLLPLSDRGIKFGKVCELSFDQLVVFMDRNSGHLPTLANCCAHFS